MAQFDFGSIDPATTSGTDLATLIGNVRDAVNSNHKGATRPIYATAGMVWVRDSANPWQLLFWSGTEDILLGTINPETGVLSLSGVRPKSFREVVSGAPKTTFTFTYPANAVAVYQNGVRLDETEFTATSGTSVVLTVEAEVGDIFFAEWF